MQLRQTFDEVKKQSSCSISPLIKSRSSDVAPRFFWALANVAASHTRAQGAALKRGLRAFFPREGRRRRTGVPRRQRGMKMPAAERFGLRFSLANACRAARGWGKQAKTLAKPWVIK